MFYDNQDLNLKACELKIKELNSKAKTLKLELLGDYSSLSVQLNMKIEELRNEIENKLKDIDIEFIKIISEDNYGWGLKYLKDSKIGQFAIDFSKRTGDGTGALGDISFAVGLGTTASGNIAFAQGNYTRAEGDFSHAEGNSTIAQNDGMHAQGTFNVGKSKETIHETGIGTSDDDRRNAFEIYKDGSLTAPELTFENIFKRKNSLITKEFNLLNYYKESKPFPDHFFVAIILNKRFVMYLKIFNCI